MKEKTKIRHKLKDRNYCSETLDKEFWGDDDMKLSCMKCGFFRIIDMNIFLKWQYCDEVTEGGDEKILSDRQKDRTIFKT